jgi:two-component system cell cycle response regulator DivK
MGKARILIVEDNVDNLSLLVFLLERAGYEVLTAPNGQMGLDIVCQAPPDLIILDLAMPVLDGWDMLHELKAEPRSAGIPVVVVTAHLISGEHNRVMDAGGDGFVSKPFTVEGLISEVERCLVK